MDSSALHLSFLVFSYVSGISISCTYPHAVSTFSHLDFVHCTTTVNGTVYLECPASICYTHFTKCTAHGGSAFLVVAPAYAHTVNSTVDVLGTSNDYALRFASADLQLRCTNISHCTSAKYALINVGYSHDVVMRFMHAESTTATERCMFHSSDPGYTTLMDYANIIDCIDTGAANGFFFNKAATTFAHWAFFGNTYVALLYYTAGTVTIQDVVTDTAESAWNSATVGNGCQFTIATSTLYSLACAPSATAIFTSASVSRLYLLPLLLGITLPPSPA